MNILNLFSEIQANPQSNAAYRRLVKYYQDHGCVREHLALTALMKEKFHDNHPPIDTE